MGKTIVSESVSSLADVDDLISAGKFRPAENLLREMQDQKEFKRNPEFWFRILLVSNLLSRPIKDIRDLHERVKTYEGWDETMEADYQRDIVLRMIRHLSIWRVSPMQVALIERMIDDGVRSAYGDPNREASWTATRARLYIATGKFAAAAASCAHADEQWRAIGDQANKQWSRNNTFHWFIAVRRQLADKEVLWENVLGEQSDNPLFIQVEDLLHQIVNNPEERNASRKLMTRLIFCTGGAGHLLYRLITKHHH